MPKFTRVHHFHLAVAHNFVTRARFIPMQSVRVDKISEKPSGDVDFLSCRPIKVHRDEVINTLCANTVRH